MADAMKSKLKQNVIFLGTSPWLLLVIVAIFYANTIAPGYTWANRGADAGDFITAIATGGVPHPSGYPTYLLLGKLFQALPFGSLAFRTNLLSLISGLCAVRLLYDLTHRSVSGAPMQRRFVAFVASLAFGLSPLFWSQAVITEVYTLHIFFMVVLLWLTPLTGHFDPNKRSWFDWVGGVIFGLAFGHQLTIVFILPVWVLVGIVKPNQEKLRSISLEWIDWSVFFRRIGGLAIGLLIYGLIPLRAKSGSPVNWGNPSDLEGFWWLLSGELYQDRVFNLAPEFIWPRFRNLAGWLLDQYGLVGLTVGIFGLLYGQPRQKRLFWITGWMFLVYSIFAIGYASSDSYALLIPAFLAFALWLGLGLQQAFEMSAQTRYRQWLSPLIGLVAIGMIAVNSYSHYQQVDASQDTRAEDFGEAVLTTAPPDAIVLSSIDEDVFVLWYFHFALGLRPDLKVISYPLLGEPWYVDTIQHIYPDVELIPKENCANCVVQSIKIQNSHPICETYFDQDQFLVCDPE